MTSFDEWAGLEIPDEVMDAAAGWMVLLDSERCDQASHLRFASWLNEDPCHRLAFEELSEVWARLRTLSDVGPLLEQTKVVRFPGSLPARPQAVLPQHKKQGGDWSALAVVVLIAIGALVHTKLATPVEGFVTAVGESRDVLLEDGSVLEMNARSALEVGLDRDRRTVSLLVGEVVFRVASDDRPFIVQTEYGDIAALGTTFAVQTDNESLQVSVIEGSVSVTNRQARMPLTEYDESDSASLAQEVALLQTGDELIVAGGRTRQRVVSAEQFARQLSWRDGMIEFDAQPLYLVVDELRRYVDISIQIADKELRELRVSGRFETGNISNFLDQLYDNYGVFADEHYSDWILLRAGRPGSASLQNNSDPQ